MNHNIKDVGRLFSLFGICSLSQINSKKYFDGTKIDYTNKKIFGYNTRRVILKFIYKNRKS